VSASGAPANMVPMPSKKKPQKPKKAVKKKAAQPLETCPFDPEVVRAVDCPYEESCPWHVRESAKQCFCSVGESPELQMRKQIASRVPKK
jgi:hypothetical protein